MRSVLHVLRQLSPGGVEYWVRDLARQGVAGWKIAIAAELPGPMDAELRSLGVSIHAWNPRRPLELARLARRFDAIHSHVHAFSGVVLTAAATADVPLRIAHSHTASGGSGTSPRRHVYLAAMRRLIDRAATLPLAVSRVAARSLFRRPEAARILPAARDLTQIPASEPIKDGHIWIGHIGRFVPSKNHGFLASLLELDSRLRLIAAGDGPLKAEIGRRLGDRVCFATATEVLRGAHCFAFPSTGEGLGLALVEAQAAGLRCLIAPDAPAESVVVPGLVTRQPLDAAAWIEQLHRDAKQGRDLTALARVLESPFEISNNARVLAEAYGER